MYINIQRSYQRRYRYILFASIQRKNKYYFVITDKIVDLIISSEISRLHDVDYY